MEKACLKWLESLAAPEGLLAKEQSEGRAILKSVGLPNKFKEAWRLTNLNKVKDIFELPVSYSKKTKRHIKANQTHPKLIPRSS